MSELNNAALSDDNIGNNGTPRKLALVGYDEHVATLEQRIKELEEKRTMVSLPVGNSPHSRESVDPNGSARPNGKDLIHPTNPPTTYQTAPPATYQTAPPATYQTALPATYQTAPTTTYQATLPTTYQAPLPAYPTYPSTNLPHTNTTYPQPYNPMFTAETKQLTSPAKDHKNYEWAEDEANDDGTKEKVRKLEAAFKKFELRKTTKGLAYEDLCIYPTLKLSDAYNIPKFDLFNGTGDPMVHLRTCCDKLIGAGEDEKIRLKLFSRSLSGDALSWFSKQKPSTRLGWEDMVADFVEIFGYSTEMVPDRFYLEKLKKKPTETFREYAIRWREEAAKVQPAMNDKEIVNIFIRIQEDVYYDKLLHMKNQKLADVVLIGDDIEEGLKSGKIISLAALQAANKAIQAGNVSLSKKRKDDPALNHYHQTPPPFYPYPHTPSEKSVYNTQPTRPIFHTPTPSCPSYQQNTQNNYRNTSPYSPRPRPEANQRPKRNYTALAESYTQLFERLRAAGLIVPIPQKVPNNPSPHFDYSKMCAYHSGGPGHETERCFALKDKIQDLIDEKVIHLKTPNVHNNPLPNHGDEKVNMIDVGEEYNLEGTIIKAKTVFDEYKIGMWYILVCKGKSTTKDTKGYHSLEQFVPTLKQTSILSSYVKNLEGGRHAKGARDVEDELTGLKEPFVEECDAVPEKHTEVLNIQKAETGVMPNN